MQSMHLVYMTTLVEQFLDHQAQVMIWLEVYLFVTDWEIFQIPLRLRAWPPPVTYLLGHAHWHFLPVLIHTEFFYSRGRIESTE